MAVSSFQTSLLDAVLLLLSLLASQGRFPQKKKKKKKSYGFHNEHYLSGTNFSITYSYFFPLKYERFIYPPILVNNVGRSYWAHSEPCLEVNIFSYNYSFYSVGPRISHCSLPQKFLLCWVGTIQGRSGEP